MNLRIKAANFLIKLGRFIQSTAVVVMRPDDLVEFNRQFYSTPDELTDWSDSQRIQSGLTELERLMLEKSGIYDGKMLVLGLGGGRDAIHLANLGFTVTGVDFIPQMIELAAANARKHGVELSTSIQEISKLEMPEQTFDMVWLSAGMYSSIPTRSRRVNLLKRVVRTLKPGGFFIFEFLWNPKSTSSAGTVLIRKILAWFSLGYLQYEKGDLLRYNRDFFHAFTTVEELRTEITQAGFEEIDVLLDEPHEFAGAIIRKPVSVK